MFLSAKTPKALDTISMFESQFGQITMGLLVGSFFPGLL